MKWLSSPLGILKPSVLARLAATPRSTRRPALGDASNTDCACAGQGVVPGASGCMTITLPPGRYELVCNLPGHYAAGMYTQLTVT